MRGWEGCERTDRAMGPRAVKGQVHTCSVCGSKEHRLETCPLPGAAQIRRLMKKLKEASKKGNRKPHKARRMPMKAAACKTGGFRQKAMKAYTKKPRAPRGKTARVASAWGAKGRRLQMAPLFNDTECLARLQRAKYVHPKPSICPSCGCRGSLRGSFTRPQCNAGMLYYKCNGAHEGCGSWHNCLKFSHLPLTKLTVGQVHSVVHSYSDLGKHPPPSSDDLAADAGAGRQQVARLVEELRTRVAKRAIVENRRGVLSGDLEIDEHGLRVTHISNRNPHFQKPKVRLGDPPKYWLLYVRVIGLRERGGRKMVVAFLPNKLVMPRAKPPPLSNEELTRCGLLKRCAKGRVVFSDGAKAYHHVITKFWRGKLKSRQVAHNRLEFTRRVRTPRGHSKIAGTQSIDGTWKHLNKHLPSSIHTKREHDVNPRLKLYVMEWAWRHRHQGEDGFSLLGSLFA